MKKIIDWLCIGFLGAAITSVTTIGIGSAMETKERCKTEQAMQDLCAAKYNICKCCSEKENKEN